MWVNDRLSPQVSTGINPLKQVDVDWFDGRFPSTSTGEGQQLTSSTSNPLQLDRPDPHCK